MMRARRFNSRIRLFAVAGTLLVGCGRKDNIPVTGSGSSPPEGRHAPTTEERLSMAEKMGPILQQLNQPIHLRAKVCDSSGQPLAGVRLAYTIIRAGTVTDDAIIHEDSVSGIVNSDENGEILIKGQTGRSLLIQEIKNEGAISPKQGRWSFMAEELKPEASGEIKTLQIMKPRQMTGGPDSAPSIKGAPPALQSQSQSRDNPGTSLLTSNRPRPSTQIPAVASTTLPKGTPAQPQRVQGASAMPQQTPPLVRPPEPRKATEEQRDYVMIETTDDGVKISCLPSGEATAPRIWNILKAGHVAKAGGQEPVVVPKDSLTEIQVSRQDNPVAAATLLVFPAWPDQAAEKQKALLSFQMGDKVLLKVEESDNLQAGWVPTPLVESGERQYAKLPRFPKRYYRIQIAKPQP